MIAALLRMGTALLLVAAAEPQAPYRRAGDPLSQPAPSLASSLRLPEDARSADEKIVELLWRRVRGLAPREKLRVVVTLHQPVGPAERASTPAEREELRLRLVAAVEHDFAAAAEITGFEVRRGLTHVPIVFGSIAPGQLRALAELPHVRAVQPNYVFHAARVQGGALINATTLRQDAGGDGSGVVVVVLDSGIDDDHGELSAKVDERRDFTGEGQGDDFGHGTQVAGIIAGNGGMAPQARLWDIKVLDANGTTDTEVLLTALDDLMPDMGSFDILIGAFADPIFRFNNPCNSSDPAASATVQAFEDAGKLLVGSSGDAGDPAGVGVPACLRQIMAIGAVYDANVGAVSFSGCQDGSTQADRIACYSNSGNLLDALAPAHCARTPRDGGGLDNCFGGTSASAAYVAGVAAQIWSLLPQTSAADLRDALQDTGRAINDSRNGITRRRIDALQAFEALGGSPPPTPTPEPTPGGPTPTPEPTPQPTPTTEPTPPPGNSGTLEFTTRSFSGSEGDGAVMVTVTRSGGTMGAVSVDYATADGSAVAGADYTAASGTLVWSSGEGGSKSFTVALLDDGDLEFAETVELELTSAGGGATLGGRDRAILTILDNDGGQLCVDGERTVCLLGRFLVTIRAENQSGTSGLAVANKLTDSAAAFEFPFLTFEEGNIEIVIKMKSGCGFPEGNPLRNFWVFIAGLTNVRVEVTIVDTMTGTVRQFFNSLGGPFFTPAQNSPDGQGNPPGAGASIQATTEALGAFPTCDGMDGSPVRAPGSAPVEARGYEVLRDRLETPDDLRERSGPTGSEAVGEAAERGVECVDSSTSVCLLDRFAVAIRAENQSGTSGDAVANKLTDSAAAFEFPFLTFEEGNIEIVIKMKSGCGFPEGNPLRNFWVFIAGLTNVRVEVTIVDTMTDTVRQFINTQGQPFFTAAPDSPDGQGNPPGAGASIQATTEALGAFPTCDA